MVTGATHGIDLFFFIDKDRSMRQSKDFTEFSVDFISLTVEFPMSIEPFVRPFDLLVAKVNYLAF